MRLIYLFIILTVLSGGSYASWWDSADYYHGYMQTPTLELVEAIKNNKSVLFIDTREPEEFAESHIPSAKNVSLRDVKTIDKSELSQYDFVVPYCLKDFRGFEVARALIESGLGNVTMMDPPGLNGWKQLGLPVSVPGNNSKTLNELFSNKATP